MPENVENVVLHLNDLGEGMISKHYGVKLLFAREMIIAKQGQRYDTINDIRRLMLEYYQKEGYSTDSSKVENMSEQLVILSSSMNKKSNLKF